MRKTATLSLLILTSATLSCGGTGDAGGGGTTPRTAALPEGAIPADSTRFPHDLHTGDNERIRSFEGRGLQCTDCHPSESVVKGQNARPGLNSHSPCDTCHRDEFYKPPGTFCQNCHTKVNPLVKGGTKMQPYPERGFRKVLASQFSHRIHLDKQEMDGKVGFHVQCDDCHSRDNKTRDPILPGHKQCARCHSEQKRARKELAMGDCQGCHPKRDVELVRGRLLITGDLIFAHKDHEKDSKGNAINCERCHADIPASRLAADVSVPAMQQCATCHEDATKTPDKVRIARCEVCHRVIRSGIAPSNHLIGTGLPEDHTLEFRRNHGDQARNKNANCGFCHEGLGPNQRDNCFQCHQVMRPRDHDIGWVDDSHGREAAADADRCVSCHNSEWCAACHAVPPRSHQPLIEFRLGGHAQAARFDLRGCFGCHTFLDTCADCHRELR